MDQSTTIIAGWRKKRDCKTQLKEGSTETQNSEKQTLVCGPIYMGVGSGESCIRSIFGADPFEHTTHNRERNSMHLPAHELAKVGVALHAGHVQGPGAAGRDRGQEGMGGGGEEGEGQEEGLAHHDESRGGEDENKKGATWCRCGEIGQGQGVSLAVLKARAGVLKADDVRTLTVGGRQFGCIAHRSCFSSMARTRKQGSDPCSECLTTGTNSVQGSHPPPPRPHTHASTGRRRSAGPSAKQRCSVYETCPAPPPPPPPLPSSCCTDLPMRPAAAPLAMLSGPSPLLFWEPRRRP